MILFRDLKAADILSAGFFSTSTNAKECIVIPSQLKMYNM